MSASGSPRRSPSGDSEVRGQLLDAARALILDEGYAAVTARRLASRAGRKPQLIHYYFASMDELFVQLVRRDAALGLERLALAAAHPQPLRSLWRHSTDPLTARLSTEYLALAHHRKAIAAEVAAASMQFRIAQRAAFEAALQRLDIDMRSLPAGMLLLAMEGLARVLVVEEGVGATAFHEEVLTEIERLLTEFEGPPLHR